MINTKITGFNFLEHDIIDMNPNDFESTMRVLQTIYKNERDHDHRWIIRSGMSELVEEYNSSSVADPTSDPDENDVHVALNLLDNKNMDSCYEFVDLGAMYTNRPLPEPRDWSIVYKDENSGNILETRSMEYADSESTTPVINDTPYKCTRTEWDNNTFIVYIEEETDTQPYDISCFDCDLDEVAYTEAEASKICSDHTEKNKNHTPGFHPRNR